MVKFRIPKISLKQEPTLREKVFFVGVMLGMLLAFSSYFSSPQSVKIKRLRADLKGVEMEMEAVQTLIKATQEQLAKQRQKPQQEPKATALVKRILKRRIPDVTEEINSTVDLLGSRRLTRGVTIKGMELGGRDEKENYTIVPIDITVRGRYTGVQRYLEALEKVERPIVVRSFALTNDSDVPGMLDADIVVQMYIPSAGKR